MIYVFNTSLLYGIAFLLKIKTVQHSKQLTNRQKKGDPKVAFNIDKSDLAIDYALLSTSVKFIVDSSPN